MTRCYICNKKDISPVLDRKQDLYFAECDYCGRYKISSEAIDSIQSSTYKNQIYLLSAAVFHKTDLGELAEITTDHIPELIASVSRKTPLGIIDSMLEYVSENVESINDKIKFHEGDIPRFVLKNTGELFEYLRQIEKLGFWKIIDPQKVQPWKEVILTLNGWKRIEELRKTKIDSNQAFVAMWFDDSDSMDQIYRDGIKSALSETGFDPITLLSKIIHFSDSCQGQ